jgi:serine/threonine protein kinase
MAGSPTLRAAPDPTSTPLPLVCPGCGKVLEGEPNFCPACGGDIRGLGGTSDTLDGPAKHTIDGRYRVLEKLGEGGMGAVYKVEHVRMGKIAALKLLRPDHAVDKGLKARFLQEARVVARLSHVNTVQVFDSGELEDGSLFIAMEYVPGKDLAWQLKAHGAMREEKAVSIAVQILSSLQEAHEAGIVHRDIKPANVMVVRRRKGGDDQVKLLDFGIAKLQEAEGRKSITGDFVGTPAYMSPEQIRGEDVDARSDLYSLGALLFELVSGRQLFVGPTPISIITQHTEGHLPRLADAAPTAQVSPAFEAVLRKALAKNKAERWGDADAMREALEGLRRHLAPSTPDLTPMPTALTDKMLSREDFDQFERRLRLRRLVMPLLALLVLAGVLVGGWRLVDTQPAPTSFTSEVEPNDSPVTATPIAAGTDVQGTIGASTSDSGDRDLFVAAVSAPAVRVTLTGIDDLNLTLELLKRGGDKKLVRLVLVDDVGLGRGERVDALAVPPGPLYVHVEEKPFVIEPNRPRRERALVPYTLRIDELPAGVTETEPNDTADTAQPLPPTRAVQGVLGPDVGPTERAMASLGARRSDAPFSSPDWFRVDDPDAVVVLVPPERGALEVTFDEPDARRPRTLRVEGSPAFITPDSWGANKRRRLRVLAGRDTLPGEAYFIATGTPAGNGLMAVLDLASRLRESGREASRRALLEGAARHLGASPEAAQLAP